VSAANNHTHGLRHRRGHLDVPEHHQALRPATGSSADLVITADMIPSPKVLDAAGALSHGELHNLRVCERAVDYLTTARSLAGKALQSIRDLKLYRDTHTTFEDYVRHRWEMSERAAYQAIEEWPLAARLQHVLGKPITASHTRALLPVAHRFGLDTAVDFYQQLTIRADADGLRMTAALASGVVRAVLERAGVNAATKQFEQTARQMMAAKTLPAAEPAKRHKAATAPLANSKTITRPTVPLELSPQARPLEAVPSLQNFTEGHKLVTGNVSGETSPLADTKGSRVYSSESLSPETLIRMLSVILQQVREVEDAIDSLVAVDPFLDGEPEELRMEIHRTLLRAAEPYKPHKPSRPST
jgi:hypothetical protein